MIGFLKKSHTVLKDTRKIEKTYETDLLGDSLETVLSKKSGQRAFRDFLKTEFCEENLDFWLACKEYQTCDSQERRTQMAARIYDEFIRNNSPKQVNLDFHTKETIRQSLEKPSLSCFRVAEKKIYILMENCSFPRFIETEPYKIFMNSISKQTGIKRNRVAVRIKSPVEDFKVNPLLLVSKD
ncbi:regulator of G-protein signaling 21-like [Cyprinodon tularosa]|uniref:regulator of G-protein signaling 21-like n=1 Tax=Cyprinodon variegatus TaxID=28743 RepID=UPI000742B6BA|nr:PREDICTED: regulator of G-protein signaling 21-like [Cyprinodon variegatus]XP_038139507.1 regulator of G-protein signaling 21-like [Cyprinodon tularosa]